MHRRALAALTPAFADLVAAELACVPSPAGDSAAIRVRTNPEAAGVALETVEPHVAALLARAQEHAAAAERERWAAEFSRIASVHAGRRQAHDAARSADRFGEMYSTAYAEAARRLRRNITQPDPAGPE